MEEENWLRKEWRRGRSVVKIRRGKVSAILTAWSVSRITQTHNTPLPHILFLCSYACSPSPPLLLHRFQRSVHNYLILRRFQWHMDQCCKQKTHIKGTWLSWSTWLHSFSCPYLSLSLTHTSIRTTFRKSPGLPLRSNLSQAGQLGKGFASIAWCVCVLVKGWLRTNHQGAIKNQ